MNYKLILEEGELAYELAQEVKGGCKELEMKKSTEEECGLIITQLSRALDIL